MRQIAHVELLLVVVGMVALPYLMVRLAPSMSDEALVSLMVLVAFGYVPIAIFMRSGTSLCRFLSQVRRSDKARGLCVGAAIILGVAFIAAAGQTWGLATAFAVGAAVLLSLAAEWADRDGQTV